MLNLEVLFNKRPFIYLVNDVYYAFGTGVCARCDKRVKYLTLHSKYQKYLRAQSDKEIMLARRQAWDIYRRLVNIADSVKTSEEQYTHLSDIFEEFKFTNAEKEEIENQLNKMVTFFKRYSLVDYYSDI